MSGHHSTTLCTSAAKFVHHIIVLTSFRHDPSLFLVNRPTALLCTLWMCEKDVIISKLNHMLAVVVVGKQGKTIVICFLPPIPLLRCLGTENSPHMYNTCLGSALECWPENFESAEYSCAFTGALQNCSWAPRPYWGSYHRIIRQILSNLMQKKEKQYRVAADNTI